MRGTPSLPLNFEASVCDLKWGKKDICTEDLSGLILADKLVLLSGLTCNSTQCVDVCLMFT